MIVYYVGGPFDLTKRVMEDARPRARLRVLTSRKPKTSEDFTVKEHIYCYLGKLQFAEDTYIYEYVPENI